MSKTIKLKKGLNIKLKGTAEKILTRTESTQEFALKPTDFEGIIPKLSVKPEQKVKAGEPLFFDKNNTQILFTSPVSGTVTDIVRGERRKILEILVNSDKDIEYKSFKQSDPRTLERDEIVATMLESGVWPFIRQRPYSIIANPGDTPKAIFISGFDSAPLAPDYDFIIKGDYNLFQTGINALAKLTNGKIHLNVNDTFPVSEVYSNTKNVQLNRIKGPHPAGNVSVQIHHINPINKGDVIWYVNPADVIIIGRLFEKGIYDASRIIALTGSEVRRPRYFKTIIGTSVCCMTQDNIEQGNKRYISGNVLTGTQIKPDGFTGFYDHQVTIIPEGDEAELFGWAKPGFKKYSVSRTYFSWLNPGKERYLNTNLHGGKRSFVVTGQYEKVVPMDIYPMQLFKAIKIGDIDLMENLGIYEVDEEDFALCEFICTSKTEIQSLIRKGLNMMRKEMS